MTQPRVRVFMGYYLPGFKAGNPTPSVSRIIEMADLESFKDHKPQTPTIIRRAKALYMSR